jgi:hypothetical protein
VSGGKPLIDYSTGSPFVNLSPMRDSCHAHGFGGVVDDVNYAPVPRSDTPLIFVAFELFHPAGLGMFPRDSIFQTTRASTLSGSASSSFRAEGFTWTA